MADRFPLIANSSSNQIQELTSGDTLDLTGNMIDNVVNVKATGITTLSNTTDSTSSTTGALIISGGVGIAKNVYIGAGLSIAGTLTYEDVTNVDSVGLITAKSGVNITGGQLTVGVAYSVGAAGVATAAGFVGPLTGNVTGDVTGSGANLTAGTVPLTSLDLDGGTDIGAGLADADLFIVDDAAGGTNRKTAASRIKTYVADLTLTTAAQTAITSVGTLAGLTVGSAGEFKVGTGVTIASTSGVSTFAEDTHFIGAGAKNIQWDKSAGQLDVLDNTKIKFGSGGDLSIFHDGSDNYISGDVDGMDLFIRSRKDVTLACGNNSSGYHSVLYADNNGSTRLYHPAADAIKLQTTNDGVSITGVGTFSAGLDTVGLLRESFNTVANKLSAGVNIDLAQGMVHYYTTNETTTATPNIRFDSTYSLNNKMKDGDVVTVSIIYKPNNAGYYAALTVDGSGVTEEWLGGSAPSSANSDGYDILTHTLLKTGDASFLCFSNVQNYT